MDINRNTYNDRKPKADPVKMLGYGPKLRGEPGRSTQDWMNELREGEHNGGNSCNINTQISTTDKKG
jgi:hypothetical protein